MNRPNKDAYTKYWVLEDNQYVLRGVKRYQEDLEKYCDELEIEKGYVQMHADSFLDSLKKQDKEIERLSKALDKACEWMPRYPECYRDCPMSDKCRYSKELPCTIEGWKEWLLEDE